MGVHFLSRFEEAESPGDAQQIARDRLHPVLPPGRNCMDSDISGSYANAMGFRKPRLGKDVPAPNVATGPRQLWSWDLTFLASRIIRPMVARIAASRPADTSSIPGREANPGRWTRHTRDWNTIGVVTLNHERECIVNSAAKEGYEHKTHL